MAREMVRYSRKADKKSKRSYKEEDYINIGSIEEMWTIQEGKCEYCECKMMFGSGINRQTNRDAVTIERVDNDLAHTMENCILACRGCNQISKGGIEFENMCAYGKLLKDGTHKFCYRCKSVKTAGEFSKGTNRCKLCDVVQQREYYQANSEEVKRKQREKYHEKKQEAEN